MATTNQLHFITTTSHSKSHRREHELQVARIRSCAGRVSHARRKRDIGPERFPIRKPRNGETCVLNCSSSPEAYYELDSQQRGVRPETGGQQNNDGHDKRTWQSGTLFHSSWQWSKGARVDPFNCIPGGNEKTAQSSLDFCEFQIEVCYASNDCQ